MRKMRHLVAPVLLIVLIMLSRGPVALAQADHPLNPEWLENDLVGTEALLSLTPIESQNIDALKETLKHNWSIDDAVLGFGANRIMFRKGCGYASIYLDVFTFNGRVAYYEIGVHGSVKEWPFIRERLIQTWKQHGGPPFKEDGAAFSFQQRFDEVFESYFRSVANWLGVMRPVDVPPDLKEPYEYLTSPMNNSYIGEGACGYGGSVLEGKAAIDLLVKAKRMDLIENVLRGYNPGGRVFAAIALLRMKKKGSILGPKIETAIKLVKTLDVPISTCTGCNVYSGLTAKSVIREFVNK